MMREELIGPHRLILGDCHDVLPTLGRFDALVTDPPYGIGEAAGKNASRSDLIAKAQDYGDADWDDEPINDDLMEALRARAIWQVVFGGNYYRLPATSCWLVWDKMNGASDFADCELAWTNLPKAVRLIRFHWNGMMRRERHVPRVHPTQKPVEVMRWCIGHLPGSTLTILDPFMGSGTTGVACVKMGRTFTGIEREQRYFDIACRRVEEAMRQPDLFIEPANAAMAQRRVDADRGGLLDLMETT